MLRLPQIQNLEHIEDSKVFGPEIDNQGIFWTIVLYVDNLIF